MHLHVVPAYESRDVASNVAGSPLVSRFVDSEPSTESRSKAELQDVECGAQAGSHQSYGTSEAAMIHNDATSSHNGEHVSDPEEGTPENQPSIRCSFDANSDCVTDFILRTKEIGAAEKKVVCLHGPDHESLRYGKRKVKDPFQPAWFSRFQWLTASREMNSLFCFKCMLFSNAPTVWTSRGISKFRGFEERAVRHDTSKRHHESVLLFDKFMRTSEEELQSKRREIEYLMNSGRGRLHPTISARRRERLDTVVEKSEKAESSGSSAHPTDHALLCMAALGCESVTWREPSQDRPVLPNECSADALLNEDDYGHLLGSGENTTNRQAKRAFLIGQVYALIQEGKTVPEISRITSVAAPTIRYWRRNGWSFERKKVSGRPKKTSTRNDRSILRAVAKNPSLSLSEIIATAGVSVSRSTIHRRLKEANFINRDSSNANILTPEDRERRLNWAMSHSHWRLPQWKQVVWTDYSPIRLKGRDGLLRAWVKSEESTCESDSGSAGDNESADRLLIWAAVWIGGRSELHIERGESMNSKRYLEVLERYIYPLAFQLGDPSTEWILMDGNATPIHSAAASEFKTKAGIRTLPWPAKSPDLNPMDNVWAMIKRKLCRILKPSDNLDRLEVLLQKEWNDLDQRAVDKIIGNMVSRVAKVIEQKG